MKRWIACLLTMALCAGMTACGGQDITLEESEPAAASGSAASGESAEPTAKIGVVFTTSGLGDNNFNDMIYRGLTRAEEELGIQFDYSEPSSNGEIVTMLRNFVQDGSYDLVITLAADSASAMEEVSAEYPDQKFEIIDTTVEGDNVRSIMKSGADQGFVAGIIAGMLTQEEGFDKINSEKVVGAVMGMDVPLLRAVVAGYEAGARYYDSEVQVISSTVGSFGDPGKGKEMATAQYNQGADIILNGAGGSGMGVFTAAEEQDKYAIGTGSNQNSLSPDHILATATFELESLVYDEAKALIDGTWEAGVVNPGMKEGAIGYTVAESNIEIPQEILDKADAACQTLIDNNIKLPETVEEVDAWLEEYGQG